MGELKVILIDVEDEDVIETTLQAPTLMNGELDYFAINRGIKHAIKADLFDVARIGNGDGIFVDDTGLLTATPLSKGFYLRKSRPYGFLMGNGLIVGCSPDGESENAKITADEIRAEIVFGSLESLWKRFGKVIEEYERQALQGLS